MPHFEASSDTYMNSITAQYPHISAASISSFQNALRSSNRILALVGAGLSAPSGLATFRGAGGLWRTHEATDLATPRAFHNNPGLVWQFYSYRRHMALKAKPNRGHYALAELARKKPNFLCVTQNVDGLSERANHPQSQLLLVHGSLFTVKCSTFFCTHSTYDTQDPIVPALQVLDFPSQQGDSQNTLQSFSVSSISAPHQSDSLSNPNGQGSDSPANTINTINITNTEHNYDATSLPELCIEDLPHCPSCSGLLRPGVVWFGEAIPSHIWNRIDNWIDNPRPSPALTASDFSSPQEFYLFQSLRSNGHDGHDGRDGHNGHNESSEHHHGTSENAELSGSHTRNSSTSTSTNSIHNSNSGYLDANSAVIDLVLVIGTSASVYPAAAYVERAREKGARVAVFNLDGHMPVGTVDWAFVGDSEVLLPALLRCVIGEVAMEEGST